MKTKEELIKKIYSGLSKDQGQIVDVNPEWEEIKIDGTLNLDDLKHIVFTMIDHCEGAKGFACRCCGYYSNDANLLDKSQFKCLNCKTDLVLKKSLTAAYSTYFAPKV